MAYDGSSTPAMKPNYVLKAWREGNSTLGAWLVISLFHDSHFQREYFPLVLCLWGLFLSPTWRMEVSDDGSVAS